MRNKMIRNLTLLFLLIPTLALAKTTNFQLDITGDNFGTNKTLKLSDVGERHNHINFDFYSKTGRKFNFDLRYKKLPSNRSYPTNIDITIKDGNGDKLGYLFLANNGIDALKLMGTIGLMVNIDGDIVDFRLNFDKNQSGRFGIDALANERLIQDTLVPKFGFQMIRPIIAPLVDENTRSQTYSLDAHPYAVNYTLKNIDKGLVEFQHNLYGTKYGSKQLLARIYFYASSLDNLREAMYAGKYFHPKDGAFKLVFYPAMGQIKPK